jgi:hypothetical protein
MTLDYYICEICILQKGDIQAPIFAATSWDGVGWWLGLSYLPLSAKRVLFSMEIIIIMSWNIWKARNECLFKHTLDVADCLATFRIEMNMLTLKAHERFWDTIPSYCMPSSPSLWEGKFHMVIWRAHLSLMVQCLDHYHARGKGLPSLDLPIH